MKIAEELRAGNCVKMNDNLYMILRAIYNKGARNASTMKMKIKNLATGSVSETVYRATDKFEDIILDRRKMQYLYGDGDFFTFMDQETYEQMQLTKDDLGDALDYLKEQQVIDIIVHGEKAVGVEMPDKVELTITYTEPAVKGDTGGKTLKDANLETGFNAKVPLYCTIGDRIIIDTRTGEFYQRAQ
jgi:elongation factor P